jgi:deoxyadenosine kinase
MTDRPLFIGIAGMIGAGKTTLAAALAAEMGLDAHYEPVADNVYLADFYADMARHAFALQVYLLDRRYQQHQQIVWRGRGGVQDRTIYEDGVFACMLTDSGLMAQRDLDTYLSLFATMAKTMRHPDVIVFLDVPPAVSLARIRERDRACEAGITLEYLARLHAEYERFIAEVGRTIPVFRVDWTRFHDAAAVARAIHREYKELRGVRTVVVSE